MKALNRPATAFRDFSEGAKSTGRGITVKNMPQLPEIPSPVQQISRLLPYQSFFDDLLLENAILPQLPNDPIVASTAKEEQISGYAIGLHPSSQTPVTIEFRIGGQPSSSMGIVLKPGQIVRPHGLYHGVKTGHFSGFRWGLPFGWLGGGMATIVVFSTPDSDVLWPGASDVIFHRQRMQILAPADVVFAEGPKNWPFRFPWTRAAQGPIPIDQSGQPQLAIVQPTEVLLSLRLATLADPATARFLFQATNDFDVAPAPALGDPDVPVLSPVRFFDYVFGSNAPIVVPSANFNVQFPVQELDQIGVRLMADDGSLVIISEDEDLQGAFVDVVRYGRL